MNEAQRPTQCSRRQAVAALAGGSVVAATMFQVVRAQDSATPEATESAADASANATSASDAERLASAFTRAREAIATAQTDLDAVSNEIDPTTATGLLAQASTLVDDAEAAVATGDAILLLRKVRGAHRIAEAAQAMIVAQLTYPGLPSQAERAVRTLTASFDRVTAVTEVETTDVPVELSGIVSDAQATYATAYDLHAAGAFAQSMAYARAASDLAEAGLTVSGEESFGHGRGDSSRGVRSGMSDKPISPDDSGSATPEASAVDSDAGEIPVTPPAPEFDQ